MRDSSGSLEQNSVRPRFDRVVLAFQAVTSLFLLLSFVHQLLKNRSGMGIKTAEVIEMPRFEDRASERFFGFVNGEFSQTVLGPGVLFGLLQL